MTGAEGSLHLFVTSTVNTGHRSSVFPCRCTEVQVARYPLNRWPAVGGPTTGLKILKNRFIAPAGKKNPSWFSRQHSRYTEC